MGNNVESLKTQNCKIEHVKLSEEEFLDILVARRVIRRTVENETILIKEIIENFCKRIGRNPNDLLLNAEGKFHVTSEGFVKFKKGQ